MPFFGPLNDLMKLAAELASPSLFDNGLLAAATRTAFPGLSGVLPGFGYQPHCDWGLGFEIRNGKAPHWTGSRNSPRTFGHFGQSGSFLWVDPEAPIACAALADRDFGDWAALDQRVATRFTIKPMDLAESAAYLRHHLALAGREEPLFADDAIARLHRVANGLPRALNNAATAALIAAAAAGEDLVDDACAKKAVAELTRD